MCLGFTSGVVYIPCIYLLWSLCTLCLPLVEFMYFCLHLVEFMYLVFTRMPGELP